jgi:hypothetical protein
LPLEVGAAVAAGGAARSALRPGHALRLFTGAPVSADVAGVVVEERCQVSGRRVIVRVPVARGANIRRRGEDVPEGATIVEAGALIDVRHVAILVAAGARTVTVRRRVRVAVMSNGNELVDADQTPHDAQIPDANRPMLLALLSRPFVEPIDAGCHRDDPDLLARVFAATAAEADLVISSGGVAGSDADHVARAVQQARPRRLRLADKTWTKHRRAGQCSDSWAGDRRLAAPGRMAITWSARGGRGVMRLTGHGALLVTAFVYACWASQTAVPQVRLMPPIPESPLGPRNLRQSDLWCNRHGL